VAGHLASKTSLGILLGAHIVDQEKKKKKQVHHQPRARLLAERKVGSSNIVFY
jgi:hypothetical protein